MKILRGLLIGVALLSAAAIAREGILFPKIGFNQPQMSSSESSIVFFRQGGDNNSIPSVWVDGTIVGSLKSDNYAQTIACPGNRHIRVDDRYSTIDRGSENVFVAPNGGTLYIEVIDAGNGHFALRTVDASSAMNLLGQKDSKSYIINRHTGRCDSKFLEAQADFLFDFNSDRLTPRGVATVDNIAKNIMSNIGSVQSLKIEGFTDRLGSVARNSALSLARARTIASHLQSRGINVPMETIGMGSRYPVSQGCYGNRATPDLKRCLAPDRRVRIEIKGLTPSNSRVEYNR